MCEDESLSDGQKEHGRSFNWILKLLCGLRKCISCSNVPWLELRHFLGNSIPKFFCDFNTVLLILSFTAVLTGKYLAHKFRIRLLEELFKLLSKIIMAHLIRYVMALNKWIYCLIVGFIPPFCCKICCSIWTSHMHWIADNFMWWFNSNTFIKKKHINLCPLFRRDHWLIELLHKPYILYPIRG